jgi:hypothetical protein
VKSEKQKKCNIQDNSIAESKRYKERKEKEERGETMRRLKIRIV